MTVGGVGLTELDLDDLRGHVALVTQEHHVFVGVGARTTSGWPCRTRPTSRCGPRSPPSTPWTGWTRCRTGLDTQVGQGAVTLSPAQAQQVALARLVLADPHTLVLDEATSLLDPRAARHLERSLAAVLEGRTVVAIAHRLHTAHDADRVAVVERRADHRDRHARRAGRRGRRLRRAVAVLARRGLSPGRGEVLTGQAGRCLGRRSPAAVIRSTSSRLRTGCAPAAISSSRRSAGTS